jgi:hypothetical protein
MSKDTGVTGLACVGLAVLTVVAVVGSALLNGWAISVLWGWFVTPLFGLPLLTIPYAIGLGLVISMFIPSTASETKDKGWSEILIALIAKVVATPLAAIAMGWIVHSFIH